MDDKPLDILVTGGSGFLGRATVFALLDRHPEWRVSILDRQPPPEALAKRIHKFIQADVTSAASVKSAFVDYHPYLVIHSAGVVPARQSRYSTKRRDWARVKAINFDGTKHVLDAVMASGCRRFVYTSSCTVITDDVDSDHFGMDESMPTGLATLHYGKSKGMAEQYVLSPKHAESGLVACALRPCTIIGPGDTAVMSAFHDLIAKGETNFVVGKGDNLYDFMYIDNAVDAHILAVENLLTSQSAAGHAFFISNQEPVYFWDFLAYVWGQFDHYPKFRIRIPTPVAWAVAFILEVVTWFTGAASTLDRGSVKDSVRTHFSNNKKARDILGYRPRVGLAEGVRRSCAYYKAHLVMNATMQRQLGNGM